MTNGTVVVGGSVAGIGVALELRRLDYPDPILVLEAQTSLPYDRPPLSKGVLTGRLSPDDIVFHPAEHYTKQGIEIRTAARAVGLHDDPLAVCLADGSVVAADAVVIASGARARPFPTDDSSGKVWTLRDLSDSTGLRAQLAKASRVAVVGGGFIGAEVAASARSLGCSVIVIDAAPLPFEPLLGKEIASRLAELHSGGGTQLRCGVGVTRVERITDGQRVHLADGGYVDAEVVVAGLGAVPNVEWLAGSGLEVGGSVACDDCGHTARLHVYAIGDVATWTNIDNVPTRHEHWTSAREQARIVAHQIAGGEAPRWHDMVPYVWSDQYGKRIQVLGHPAGADQVRVVDEDPSRGSFVALYGREGRLVAVAGCNAAGKTMRYRAQLVAGALIDEA
jgi:NADPH-dependent 2,4-dienoyl-CoA reductase/sulfur reductase-like enzyme